MESNKEDACRAKQVAEKKLGECDLAGAKKFALKAQQMYPSLEGLSHLIAVLDVRLSAANDPPDWYAILQVPTSAEEPVIKRQYRRLALLLHPDKNKCVGAEEAFKLIGEACRLLSHPTNRAAYDRSRNKIRIRNPLSAFWTLCPCCNVRFQFAIEYANRYLICPSCGKPFMAILIASTTPVPSATDTKEEEEEKENRMPTHNREEDKGMKKKKKNKKEPNRDVPNKPWSSREEEEKAKAKEEEEKAKAKVKVKVKVKEEEEKVKAKAKEEEEDKKEKDKDKDRDKEKVNAEAKANEKAEEQVVKTKTRMKGKGKKKEEEEEEVDVKTKTKMKGKGKKKEDIKFDKTAFDRLFAGGMKRASDDQSNKRAKIQVD